VGFSIHTVAIKNLRRKPFRNAVLVLSIALLVCLLVFAVSFSTSVSSSIKKATARLGADLIIVPTGAAGFAQDFLLEAERKSFYMPKSVIEKVKKIEGIKEVTYQTYLQTIPGVCCDVAQTQVIAFDQETDFIVKPWLQKSIGRPLQSGEAIAGYETAENLGLGLLEVEKTIFNKQFKIVGVLEKTGTGLDNALFMTEKDLEKIIASGNSPVKKGMISIIFARVDSSLDPYHVALEVEGKVREVDVVPRKEMGRELLNTLKDINKIFLISIIIASVLTVFLTWAIFSAIANERAREIGIMRAIGARQSHIVKVFILEVMLLGGVGSFMGMSAGLYLSLILTKGFTLLKKMPAGITLTEQIFIAVMGILLGVSICIVGALVPVNQIKKKEPLLAIKEE
jgi:putative ABC transport system permease protein